MGNIMAPASASLFDAIAGGDADAAVQTLQKYPELAQKRLGTKRRNLYHICAANGQMTVLRSLCEYVWRTVPDETGRLHYVAPVTRRVHPTIRQAINAIDQKGLTPLSLACKNGHARVVEYLIAQGADPWVKDRLMGRAPLHHAARANHPDCIEAILSSPYVADAGKCRNAQCRLVDYPSNSGYTPLHYAAASHSVEAAAALCRHGADPNAKTWDVGFDYLQLERGCTPLHAAARYQSLDVSMLLLKYWHDNLKGLEVTDPRVVENNIQVKPYQMPGVKLNKALHRVLDPATLIDDIADPFGETTKPIVVPPSKAAHLQKMRSSAPRVYGRQDSDLSRLSEGSGGGGSTGVRTGREGRAQTAGPGVELSESPGNAAVCRCTLPQNGSISSPCDAGASSTLQVPAGWEDLLPSGGRGGTSNFISVYRCSDLERARGGPSAPPETHVSTAPNLPPQPSYDPARRHDEGSRRGAPSASPLPAAGTLGRTRSGQVLPLPHASPPSQPHRATSLPPPLQQQSRRHQQQHLGQQHLLAPTRAPKSVSDNMLSSAESTHASAPCRGAGLDVSSGNRAGNLLPRTGGTGSPGFGFGGSDVRMLGSLTPFGAATTEGCRSPFDRNVPTQPDPTVHAAYTADGVGGRNMRRTASSGAKETPASSDADRSVGRSLAKAISRKFSYLSSSSHPYGDKCVRPESDAFGAAADNNCDPSRLPMVISAWDGRPRTTTAVH